MEKTTKIFKISLKLEKEGFIKNIKEFDMKETTKCFIGDGQRIPKDKIMKVATIWHENHQWLNYHIYCFEEDLQKAFDIIKKHIIDKVKTYKSEIDVLMGFIEK